MSLEISPSTCLPGGTASLTISSTLKSTVSLLAIDQRVLLLKSGNDVSQNEIFDELDKYNINDDVGGGGIILDVPFGIPRRPWFWFETFEMKFNVS